MTIEKEELKQEVLTAQSDLSNINMRRRAKIIGFLFLLIAPFIAINIW